MAVSRAKVAAIKWGINRTMGLKMSFRLWQLAGVVAINGATFYQKMI